MQQGLVVSHECLFICLLCLLYFHTRGRVWRSPPRRGTTVSADHLVVLSLSEPAVRSSLFRAPSSFIQILASCWRACQTSQEVLLHRETLMSLVTALKLICQINLFGMSYSLLFFFAIYLNIGGGKKCMTDIITSLTHFNLFSLQEAALLNQTTYLLMRVAVIIKKKWYWFICCAVFTSMKTNL